MTNKDGRVIATENEIKILRALHRFGWLRTKDIAILCWRRWAVRPISKLTLGPSQPTASALRMAQRTLRRLKDKRHILPGRGNDGSVIYALAQSGTRRLRELGITATTGKDLVRSFSNTHFRHRCIANEIAISCIVNGFRASTEREIAQGLWIGGTKGIAGKSPDVLVRSGNKMYFVEVERSRRNAKDYKSLLIWAGKALQDHTRRDGPQLLPIGQVWSGIIFICTTAFKNRLLHDLISNGWSQTVINALISFETELYYFEDTLFPK